MRTPEDTPTDPDQLIRFGTIASVDLTAARCIVTLDDDSATAAVRWIEVRAGKTRTWSPPSAGEQVVLLCPAGEIGAAVALRGLVSDAFPAAGDSLTEILGQYDDGALFTYDPVGHVLTFALPAGGKVLFAAPGGVAIEGDVSSTGTIAADTDVLAAGISGKGHKHSGIQRGGAVSDGPQ